MKQFKYIILLIVLSTTAAIAQPDRPHRMERIHAIKVAYLTDKLHLTSDQAEKFWPVYRQYEDEIYTVKGHYFKKRGGPDEHADQEASMKSIDDDLEMQEKVLAIRKRYKNEFLNIITPQQLATLYEAEREFKRMLIQQLKDRHERESRQLR